MRNPILSIILAFSLLSFSAISQTQIGWHSDNFSGINGTLLNPANSSTYNLSWDLNLGEIGYFFDNNYAFLGNTGILDLYRQRNDLNIEFVPDIEGPLPQSENIFLLDAFEGNERRFYESNLKLLGPSFLLKFGNRQQYSLGITTGARMMFSSHNIPGVFSYNIYEPRPFKEDFKVAPLEGSITSWNEIGLHYAYRYEYDNQSISFGFTAKRLAGYEAAYFSVNSNFDYAKISSDTISGSLIDVEYAFTSSAIDNYEDYQPTVNGLGLGLDIGLVWTYSEYEEEVKPYDYKVGLALLDLGAIRFNQNAEKHSLKNPALTNILFNDFEQFVGIEEFDGAIKTFSHQVLGDSLASLESNNFTMAMAPKLSLEFDYAPIDYFFVNMALVQRLPSQNIASTQGSIFAISPRFEHRWFGASVSALLYEWQHLRLGTALRLGYLVIGSDNLGSFFGQTHLTGTDFYAALKFNPFDIGYESRSRTKRKRGKVKCYKF